MISFMCCIHGRDALVTEKNHPNWEFVGSSSYKTTNSLSALPESVVAGSWSLCCKGSLRLPKKFRAHISLLCQWELDVWFSVSALEMTTLAFLELVMHLQKLLSIVDIDAYL